MVGIGCSEKTCCKPLLCGNSGNNHGPYICEGTTDEPLAYDRKQDGTACPASGCYDSLCCKEACRSALRDLSPPRLLH